ncbi:hypothetical protein F5Y17DRAFT_35832 [Xylariaceae sp. FL0594]|nr:hypothetical protein F5Y17DRAFT_35832 [Xylariaceae sp. FL0594]
MFRVRAVPIVCRFPLSTLTYMIPLLAIYLLSQVHGLPVSPLPMVEIYPFTNIGWAGGILVCPVESGILFAGTSSASTIHGFLIYSDVGQVWFLPSFTGISYSQARHFTINCVA